jgi:ATP-dependent protease Clp ATPase subunit
MPLCDCCLSSVWQPCTAAQHTAQAMSKGTGTRGLRTIMEHLLTEAMYEVSGRGGAA